MGKRLLRLLPKKGIDEMLILQITNDKDFVALCKRFEVKMLFLSGMRVTRQDDDEDQSIDGGEKTVGTYRSLIKFEGHDAYLQFDCTRMVPDGWRYNSTDRTIFKALERKTDAEKLLLELGANQDQVKRLMKVKASELHEIQDESTEDEEVITRKTKVSWNDFDFRLTENRRIFPELNLIEASLHVSKEGFGRGTLGYKISVPFRNHVLEKRKALEKTLEMEIPGLVIFEGAIAYG